MIFCNPFYIEIFNNKLDDKLINKYPTLFYFINKNSNTYQQIKDNFIIAYKSKKLYNNQNEFYYSFYYWIFALRILSSINCIHLSQYNKNFEEFASNEVKKLIKDKINCGKEFGTKWINILLDEIDPLYEDSNIISIYKYIKNIIIYSSNIKKEFQKEATSLIKQILSEIFKLVFDDSVNDFLNRQFPNENKLLKFFKNPDNELKIKIEKDVSEDYKNVIESALYKNDLKPFYDNFILNFEIFIKEIKDEINKEKDSTEKLFIEKNEKEKKKNNK